MFGILARLLEILYSVWPSYGGSIVLFTVVVMAVLMPLTFKSTRSMLAMQALQPEMKKLQNRYKDDRQKLNEEMMKFYQENKISPLGGCLPMLIQLPVFFILYAVLLGLTKRGPFGGDLGYSVACSVGGTSNACTTVGTFANAGFFHPAYLKTTSTLYRDLSTTRIMDSFGLDLSQSAWGEFARGLTHALPYVLMVVVVMGLTYLQQQQIQKRQPKNADQNPTQQMMMKVMPVAMGFVYVIIPAGVVVYFLVSSLFRVAQQGLVTRTFYSGPNAVVIPATATESSDGPIIERKRFLDQFKPSAGALPQVGKEAKKKRAESFGGAPDAGGEGGSASPKKTKSGSSGSSKAGGGKSPSETKQSGGKSGSSKKPPTSDGKGTKTSTASGKSGSKSASNKSASNKSADTTPSAGDRPTRPSRTAPSRKAPQRPGSGDHRGRG